MGCADEGIGGGAGRRQRWGHDRVGEGSEGRLRERHDLGGRQRARVDAQLGKRAREERARVGRQVAAPPDAQCRGGARGQRDGGGQLEGERAVEEGRELVGRGRGRVDQRHMVPGSVAGHKDGQERDNPNAVVLLVS